MLRDLRFAVRTLLRQPVFSAVVIATLAIVIGANTAIFALLYAMLEKPFPFGDAQRLVKAQSMSTKAAGTLRGVSPPDADDYRAYERTLADIGVYEKRIDNLVLRDGRAHSVRSALVTAGVLRAFEVKPLLGRIFVEEEDRPGGDTHKVVLGFGLWQNGFGGDPEIVGKRVRSSVSTYTVVGVLPRGFTFPGDSELWIPLQNWIDTQDSSDDRSKTRGYRWYEGVALLDPGVTLEQAEADLTGIAEKLAADYPTTNDEFRPRLTNLRDAETRAYRGYLFLVFATTALVLLIGCANVANLQLARAAARSRELSLRLALGAGGRELARQLLTESAVLSLAGGALGLGLAAALLQALPAAIPSSLPSWIQLELGLPALLWNLGASVGAALLFGVAPAIAATRLNLSDAMKEGAKSTAGSGFLRKAFVVSEVALATLLLVGAGLLFKSFQNLLAVEPGFEPERVLTLELSPQHRGSYREQTISLNELHRRVERRLEEIPQVIAAGGSTRFPYMGEQVERSAGDVEIQGENDEASRHREPSLIIDITPRYFQAMGIPLLEGRFFNDGDGIDSPKVVMVSQRTAERLFPGRSALGRGIRFAYTDPPDPWGIIVGVVGNVKYFASESDSGLELYYPISQYKAFRFRTALRVKGDPESVIPQIREAVAEASPETAIADLAVMNDVIDDSLWQPRLWGTLLTAFATLALVLSALGVYGILSFSVSRWTREIGIRIALGAGMARIHGMVLGSGLRLVGLGLALGLAGSLLFGRSLASLLFGVSAYDPSTLLAVTALLLLVAAAACLVPAFRASRIDPTEALRQE